MADSGLDVYDIANRAGARALIWGVYINIFSFCQINFFCNQLLFELFQIKEITRAEHEYMNIHPPPPPINVLAPALIAKSSDIDEITDCFC